jgi:excisionase family DNA binding protein
MMTMASGSGLPKVGAEVLTVDGDKLGTVKEVSDMCGLYLHSFSQIYSMDSCYRAQKLCRLDGDRDGMDEERERAKVTTTEAARLLGISHRTILDRLQRGLMQGERISPRLWLVPHDELERVGVGRLKTGPKPKRDLSS